MLIKTPTEFKTFENGVCEVWTSKRNKPDALVCKLHYGDQTVTYKRYYQARAAQTRIDRVIRVPYRDDIQDNQLVKLRGLFYSIEQSQPIRNTNPGITVLTLKRLEVQP